MLTHHKRPLLAVALAATTLTSFTLFSKPASALFDKTRFITDVGVAFFAFHHWVWNPYKHGAFQPGAPHRTAALVKAGLATLFAVNRLKAADHLAHTSKSPLLHKLAGAIDRMEAAFASVGQNLKNKVFDQKGIDNANNSLLSVDSLSKQAGMTIHDVPIKIPGVG